MPKKPQEQSKSEGLAPEPRPSQSLPFNRLLVYAAAITLLVVPLFVWPSIKDYFVAKTVVLTCLIAVLAGLWGIKIWREGTLHLRVPWVVFAFGLFVLASLLSLLAAVNSHELLQSLFVAFLFLILYLILANETQTGRDRDILLVALLLAGVGSGVSALLHEAGIVHFASGPRLISTLGNPNYLGGYLAYMIPPWLILLLGKRSSRFRLVIGSLILFAVVMIVILNQMGVLMGLAVGGLFGLALALTSRHAGARIPWHHVAIFSAIVLLAAGLLLLRVWVVIAPDVSSGTIPVSSDTAPLTTASDALSDVFVASSNPSALLEDSNLLPRLLLAAVSARMFVEHPLTGIGHGNYKILYTRYEAELRQEIGESAFDTIYTRAEHAHNDYLQAAAEMGAVGIAAVALFISLFIASTWIRLRDVRHDRPQAATEILLISSGFVALLSHALVSFPAHLPGSLLAGVTILGLLCSPVYGRRATGTLSLGKRQAQALASVLLVFAGAGVLFAAREVAGHDYLNQGRRYMYTGASSQAIAPLRRSVALTFSPRSAYYYLATAEARVGTYDDALADFELALRSLTADEVYLIYADLASQLGEIDAARGAIEILLFSNPPPAMKSRALFIQAQIEQLAGNVELAFRLLGDLLELDRQQERARIARGAILAECGRSSEARTEYEDALRILSEKIQPVSTPSSRTTLSEYGDALAEQQFFRAERDRVLDALDQLEEHSSP